MKKLVKLALAGALSVSALSANDLLSKATDGKIVENSFGIKALNSSEMSKIKGGYDVVFVDGFGISSPNLAQVGYAIVPTQLETRFKVLCGPGQNNCVSSDSNPKYLSSYDKNNYSELARVADPAKGDLVVVTATASKIPNLFGSQLKLDYGALVYDGTTGKTRSISRYSLNAISDTIRVYKNEMAMRAFSRLK